MGASRLSSRSSNPGRRRHTCRRDGPPCTVRSLKSAKGSGCAKSGPSQWVEGEEGMEGGGPVRKSEDEAEGPAGRQGKELTLPTWAVVGVVVGHSG